MLQGNTCMGIFKFKTEKDDKYEKLFDLVIYPLIESHTGLKCVDARRYYEPSSVKMDLIADMIKEATLVVVEISEKNPNVFFEFGIGYCLRKPTIILCSEENYKKEPWKERQPFDIQGRDMLIYKDEDDLRIQLGKYIFDALYTTKYPNISWASKENTLNYLKDPRELYLHPDAEVWNSLQIHNNITIRYKVKILEWPTDNKNPDIRLFISYEPKGYPRIVVISPWENSEINPDSYECHIDYFYSKQPTEEIRLQQVAVAKKKIKPEEGYDFFLTFCWPNLVVESTFFEKDKERLIYPVNTFRERGYPVHFNQYIGFYSKNSRVKISDISIKEVFL